MAMLQSYWIALAVFAAACTYLWGFREQRITLTASLATGTWAILALSGGDVVKRTQCCEVAMGVPDAIRYVLAALALLSFIALLLHHLGTFPPDEEIDNIPDQEANA